jgi:hypothetical protein
MTCHPRRPAGGLLVVRSRTCFGPPRLLPGVSHAGCMQRPLAGIGCVQAERPAEGPCDHTHQHTHQHTHGTWLPGPFGGQPHKQKAVSGAVHFRTFERSSCISYNHGTTTLAPQAAFSEQAVRKARCPRGWIRLVPSRAAKKHPPARSEPMTGPVLRTTIACIC